MPDVHWCVTVDYQQMVDSNIANQIHGFKIDYGKFILICVRQFNDVKSEHSYRIALIYFSSLLF